MDKKLKLNFETKLNCKTIRREREREREMSYTSTYSWLKIQASVTAAKLYYPPHCVSYANTWHAHTWHAHAWHNFPTTGRSQTQSKSNPLISQTGDKTHLYIHRDNPTFFPSTRIPSKHRKMKALLIDCNKTGWWGKYTVPGGGQDRKETERPSQYLPPAQTSSKLYPALICTSPFPHAFLATKIMQC